MNETVSIKSDPEDVDVSTIMYVKISEFTIYSIPSEIFTKFPDMKGFWAWGQKVQEIKPDTFWDGKKLEWISLQNNNLTFLRKDTFKGK
jgi:hypothetical protein